MIQTVWLWLHKDCNVLLPQFCRIIPEAIIVQNVHPKTMAVLCLLSLPLQCNEFDKSIPSFTSCTPKEDSIRPGQHSEDQEAVEFG